MRVVRHRKSFVFSASIRWAAILITLIFLFFLVKNSHALEDSSQWNVFAILIVAAFILWSTRQFVEIDVAQRWVHHYISIAGLKIGRKDRFEGIEKIYINRRKYSQGSYIFPRSIVNEIQYGFFFQSYVKFSDGDKIELAAHRDKDILVDQLTEMNRVLQTEIYDNTSGEAVRIY